MDERYAASGEIDFCRLTLLVIESPAEAISCPSRACDSILAGCVAGKITVRLGRRHPAVGRAGWHTIPSSIGSFHQPERGQKMDIKKIGSQPSAKGPAEWFTGTVRIDPLFEAPGRRRAGASVTFEPGARTAWHTHPLGQTLIVTAGCGWAQPGADQSRKSGLATSSGLRRARSTGTVPRRPRRCHTSRSRRSSTARRLIGWKRLPTNNTASRSGEAAAQ